MWEVTELNHSHKHLAAEEEEARKNGALESRKESLKIARLDLNRKIERCLEKLHWYNVKQEERKKIN